MADFDARLEALSTVLAFVERRAEALGAAHDTALRATLIVEELFVNCVRHGRAPATSSVHVELQAAPGDELELAFEDHGIACDPFSHLADATHRRAPEDRPVGGLGVVLIDGFSLRHEYRRRGTRNCVRVWLARGSD
ncbi:MAG: ATP-binding protein [Panacagrimonas sp.]|jgi:anti-sigma regulatory factor (Ser/Thr protein kinase)|nr:ATP-binding protein [Panacagrimonas sp.]MCC2656442.1 ATP-binding protein [Panacagrimonas sp.]